MTEEGRGATTQDAILGVRPRIVCEPETISEAAGIIGECARAQRKVAFVGGGTEIDLGNPPENLDTLIRTVRLNRIIEHSPSDQIVTVEGGCTLSTLARVLADSRQRLAIDPPAPQRATIGGVVASNAFGPRRCRFGSIRDLLIGISIVRADGIEVHGGGKVVKNVAGFDLPKLMVGSLGTLGLIATATFRLHPLPQEEVTSLLPARDARGVRGLVAGLRDAQLEPSSIVALRRPDGLFDVAVRFEGFHAGVAEQEERLLELERRDSSDSCRRLEATEAEAFWARHDALRITAPLCAKVAALPTAIEPLAADVLPKLSDAFAHPGFVWYATLGLGFFSGTPTDADADAGSAALLAARRSLEGLGGTLILARAPAGVRERVSVWGSPPAALGLMKNVKDRLDPDHRLAPGRFVGGI